MNRPMGINKSRTDPFVRAVDDLDIRRRDQVVADLANDTSFDENVRLV